MLIDPINSSLLLIDVQKKLFPKIHDSKSLEKAILDCLEVFYTLDIPIYFSEQYPKGLGSTIDNILEKVMLDRGKFSTVVREITKSYPFMNKTNQSER